MALNIFLVVLSIYLIITVFLYLYQRNFLYHPNINSKSAYELNHKVDKIIIQSDNKLVAWYHKKNKNLKTLVFFHGNAGNLSNRIYKLNEFSKMNLNYLIFAYRGFNGNNGKPTEEGLYKDANSVIDWLKSNDILENQIILYGESLGTAISVNIAQDKEFAGIILEAPFTSMIEMGKKYYPIFPVKYLLNDKYETIKKIKNLRSPILIMHGKKDKIVPFSMGKKIYNLSNNPKFKYFNDYDDHMMEYNSDLTNSINTFINNLN
tara:strand:+ start:2021 stop:2809 length:789 start_codon:yes stop_codon:yes gene_type:complete